MYGAAACYPGEQHSDPEIQFAGKILVYVRDNVQQCKLLYLIKLSEMNNENVLPLDLAIQKGQFERDKEEQERIVLAKAEHERVIQGQNTWKANIARNVVKQEQRKRIQQADEAWRKAIVDRKAAIIKWDEYVSSLRTVLQNLKKDS